VQLVEVRKGKAEGGRGTNPTLAWIVIFGFRLPPSPPPPWPLLLYYIIADRPMKPGGVFGEAAAAGETFD